MVKNLFMKVTTGLMLLACGQSYAGSNYWSQYSSKVVPSNHPTTVTAKNYSLLSLDQNTMRSFLFGLSTDYNQAQSIQLPSPDQKLMNFHIWKTPMMEKGLADRYPDIQTFTAVSDEDPSITAKLEYTLLGFSALVYNGNNTFVISPYNHADEGYYVSYYKKDFYSTLPTGACLVKDDATAPIMGNENHTMGGDGNIVAAKKNGSTRHIYRVAMSCTGEYAINAANGVGITNPTVAQILSIIVATVNHVNGYYEREFSVSMNLVAMNDAILFVDPVTDPYTCNNNTTCLIDESNNNINSIIGANNYDIGHTLCTAGSGLAQLSAVCGSGGKGRAVSTSGGATDVSMILHEMGHQFSANHTFNSDAGGCHGNGNQSTAYEPGAGISNMSYSGSCDPDNVGTRVDDYFHVNSLMEVSRFLMTQGSTCGDSAIGSTPVNVPPISESYYIPRNTPFELTAPTVAPPQVGASVLYNWEQWDLGNYQGTEADAAGKTSGPLFRSYTPTTDKIRSYPEYANIIAGTYGDGAPGKGQRLAKVARSINFKLTVRSIYQGWGTFQFMDDTLHIKADEAANAFRVTSQTGAETWNPGETKVITWDVAGSNGDSVRCGYVNIYLSKDGGATFPFLLNGSVPNNGHYTITVPDVYGVNGHVKVKGAGTIFYDINKGTILLNGNPLGTGNVALANDVTIYPNPATSRIIINNKTPLGKTLKAVMYNSVGQQVWSGTLSAHTEITTSGFARGSYMIQILNESTGERNTEKVILQ